TPCSTRTSCCPHSRCTHVTTAIGPRSPGCPLTAWLRRWPRIPRTGTLRKSTATWHGPWRGWPADPTRAGDPGIISGVPVFAHFGTRGRRAGVAAGIAFTAGDAFAADVVVVVIVVRECAGYSGIFDHDDHHDRREPAVEPTTITTTAARATLENVWLQVRARGAGPGSRLR